MFIGYFLRAVFQSDGHQMRGQGRQLLDWKDNSPSDNAAFIFAAICIVLFAGCMSGLTLGLMSLDIVELEVLKRSGNEQERRQAKQIIPLVKNAHYLLVTLLLCNAAAMEALPIVLDNIVHAVTAVVISVTAVLFFGEIIPQAVCSKHGLLIGTFMAWPVRILMLITFPISWPISKLLDYVLGGEHSSLFRRHQLKALVSIHALDEGFGGRLSKDEISIITGALDLTKKHAFVAMTPIDKVFMLSSLQILDEGTIDTLMSSKPYSRVPIYRGEDKKDIMGLVLVKEILEYVTKYPNSPVSSLRIRPLPRLCASTPMYDLLKLFRTGRAHMALLTQPMEGDGTDEAIDGKSPLLGSAGNVSHLAAKEPVTPPKSSGLQPGPARAFELETMEHLQQKSPDRPLVTGTSTPSSFVIDIQQSETDRAPSHLGALVQQFSAHSMKNFFRGSLNGGTDVASARGSDHDDDDIDAMMPIPLIAKPGEPIGIITIEDVIEELMGIEIIDETDRYVDNEQILSVEEARPGDQLSEAMKVVMTLADRARSAVVKTLNFTYEPSPMKAEESDRKAAILQAANALKKVSSGKN